MFKYDIHVHAKPSIHGKAALQNYVDMAVKVGLDGICFTEHSHTEKFHTGKVELSVPDGFTVMFAQEVTTSDYGDVLVFGANHGIKRGVKLSAIDPNNEYAIVKAHPWRGRCTLTHGWWDRFDAIELFNGGRQNDETAKLQEFILSMGLTTTGGSDAHRRRGVGKCFTHTVNRVSCIDDLVREIVEGHVIGGTNG